MSKQVNVQSIDTLRQFRASLREYSDAVQDVLDCLQLESQRTVDWVQYDRAAYWRSAVREASDLLKQASTILEMKQLVIANADRPACTEERKAVQNARRRMRYSEQQVDKIKKLIPALQHEADEFQGVLSKLAQLVESNLPAAMASLDRMIESLTKYTLLQQSSSTNHQIKSSTDLSESPPPDEPSNPNTTTAEPQS